MDSRDNNVTPSEESPPAEPTPETPTPVEAAEPILRVTAPTPSRTCKQKDEKKAAARRAGAAARKAKKESLERELAAAKEALRDPAFVADPGPPDEEAAPPRHSDKKEKEDGPALFTWPVGALAAAVRGLTYWSKFHRAEPSPLPLPPEEKKPPVLLSSTGPAQHLKVVHNPHYME